MHRQTIFMLFAAVCVLVCANYLSLRIPFDDGEHHDGYLIKRGWPCAFHEQNEQKIFWEWQDLAIDCVVALSALTAIGLGSEWALRKRIRYSHFLLLVVLSALLLGLNLHEWRADDRSVRGWPFIALVNGPYFLHHNRVELIGLLADLSIALMAVAAACRLRSAPGRASDKVEKSRLVSKFPFGTFR